MHGSSRVDFAANARETKMKNVVKNIFVSLARYAAQFSILIGTESKFIDLKLEIALSTPYENILLRLSRSKSHFLPPFASLSIRAATRVLKCSSQRLLSAWRTFFDVFRRNFAFYALLSSLAPIRYHFQNR